MALFVKNVNKSLCFSLNVLKFYGFLAPNNYSSLARAVLIFYSFFWFMFIIGIYVIVQTGDLIQVWGDLNLMTSSTFLLFTNLAFATKMANLVLRRREILGIIEDAEKELSTEVREDGKEIVKSFNRQTTRHLYLYIWLSGFTVMGWAASAEKNKLPLRAWYPYDTSKSPAYELTYIHQSLALVMAALVNISLDTLVTSLIALCCCRLRLLSLSLKTLCLDCTINKEETNNLMRFSSMLTYLLGMMLEVFLYCYQGNQLMEESSNIADAAYMCPWYLFPLRVRRALLVLMVRARRVAKLTAGGFTTLSLACFMSIIKASYTFFTVLQRVEDKK